MKEASNTTKAGEAEGNDGDSKSVRLVCVPSFALTGQAVMVNLNTLATEVISFH
jgi:hypothetical protein